MRIDTPNIWKPKNRSRPSNRSRREMFVATAHSDGTDYMETGFKRANYSSCSSYSYNLRRTKGTNSKVGL